MYTFLDSLDDGGVDSLQDIKDTQYYVWCNYSTWLEARETTRFKINCKKKHGQFYVFYPSFTTSVTCGSWRDMQIRWPGSQDQLQPSLLHDFEQALSLLGSNSSLEFLWTLWSNVFAVQLNSDVELWCISHRNTGVSEKMRQGRGEERRVVEMVWRLLAFSGICFSSYLPPPSIRASFSPPVLNYTLTWVGMLIWARRWCDMKRGVPSSICKQLSS